MDSDFSLSIDFSAERLNFDLYHKEPFKTIMGLDTDLVFGFEDLLIEQILDILEFKSKLFILTALAN